MIRHSVPLIFRQLQEAGCLSGSDIVNTRDGFYLAYRSVAQILAHKSILDFLDSEGRRLPCDRFFDDWFLYAVPDGDDCTVSLLKLREQEFDRDKDIPADGDMPGVTVCFICFDSQVLMDCLGNPSDKNLQRLNGEINRVVARRGQHHHPALKKYFADPMSQGAYLVAEVYTKHIASFAENGCLAVPVRYKEIACKHAGKRSRKFARLPRFVEQLDQEAGRTVCDGEMIYIRDASAPDRFERAAILATHTGNISPYSFAAEVEYHARFLVPAARIRLPLIGRSIYDSAIRADMSVADAEFQGPAPFHKPESRLVRRQYTIHKRDLE